MEKVLILLRFALVLGQVSSSFQEKNLKLKASGEECYQHSDCTNNCCLIGLLRGLNFCAPKGKIEMLCLPQTTSETTILCSCHWGLSCRSIDRFCPCRCLMF
ncbi:colipase-like protein 2 [Trichosurus vulpecula]|uniref:colipase-like protein 2 n=1 Tax=Trichosurus vulpecula TaxID=9337 RepID=UPI00186ADB3F|nr:colipase-like protein 2 [Trichosurus vulpecula]